MRAVEDMVYDHLSAVRFTGEQNKWGSYMFEWKCDCGVSGIIAPETNIKQLKIKACKECRKKILKKRHVDNAVKELTGKRIGMLVAERPTEKYDKNGSIVWLFRCDCGGTIERTMHSLKQQNETWNNEPSCGCNFKKAKLRIGTRRGNLELVSDTGKHDCQNYSIYNWRCDCGNEVEYTIHRVDLLKFKMCEECRQKDLWKQNMTKEKIGMLTPIEPIGLDVSNCVIWKWRCDCGNIIERTLSYVTHDLNHRNHVPNCGCINSFQPAKIGDRVGNFTAIKDMEQQNDWGGRLFEWRCDCGNTIISSKNQINGLKYKCCDTCRKIEMSKNEYSNSNNVFGTNIVQIMKDDSNVRADNTSGHTGVYYDKKTGRWFAGCTFQGATVREYADSFDDAVATRNRLKAHRDEFLAWYESLTEEEKVEEANSYKENQEYFKQLYKEKARELFENRKLDRK